MFSYQEPAYAEEIKELLHDFKHYVFVKSWAQADRVADLLKELFGIKLTKQPKKHSKNSKGKYE